MGFGFVWLFLVCLPYIWGTKEGGRIEMITLFAVMAFSGLLLYIGLRVEATDYRKEN